MTRPPARRTARVTIWTTIATLAALLTAPAAHADVPIAGDWTATVRLQTGELIVFERLGIYVVRETVHGTFTEKTDPAGDIAGAAHGNDFQFTVKLTRGGLADINRHVASYDFRGTIGGDKASGKVVLTDNYGVADPGTFTMSRYGLDVKTDPPADPGPPGKSPAVGTWSGTLTMNPGPGRKVSSLQVKLTQDGSLVKAKGTLSVDGKTDAVEGTGRLVGTACDFTVGTPTVSIAITGRVKDGTLTGPARATVAGKDYFGEVALKQVP